MGRADYYAPGQWNALCDRCGFKYKSGDLRLTWDNLRCCPKCWEPRQPQDFVRNVPDRQNVPWSRPQGSPVFVIGAEFTGTPLSGANPLVVNFTDASTGNPTSWLWTFGDGQTSTLQNPSHTYTRAGSYTVTLTVSNSTGSARQSRADYVTVTPFVLNPSRQYSYSAPAAMSAERKSSSLFTGVTTFNRTSHVTQDYNVLDGTASGAPVTVTYSDFGAGRVTNAARNSVAHGIAGNADLLTYLAGVFTSVSPAGFNNIVLETAPVWVDGVNYFAFATGASRLKIGAVADSSGAPTATRDIGAASTDAVSILADQNGGIYYVLNSSSLHQVDPITLADITVWDISGHGNIGSSLAVQEHDGVVYAIYQDATPHLRFLLCHADGTVTSRPDDGISTAGLFNGGGNFQRAYYGIASIGNNQMLDGLGVILLS